MFSWVLNMNIHGSCHWSVSIRPHVRTVNMPTSVSSTVGWIWYWSHRCFSAVWLWVALAGWYVLIAEPGPRWIDKRFDVPMSSEQHGDDIEMTCSNEISYALCLIACFPTSSATTPHMLFPLWFAGWRKSLAGQYELLQHYDDETHEIIWILSRCLMNLARLAFWSSIQIAQRIFWEQHVVCLCRIVGCR